MGVFTSTMAICAQIAIPGPGGVPFTLQAWAIALAGLILGPKNGVFATLLYISLGAVGAPVFANFSGGFGVILGPTGGFILSFPILAFFAGIGGRKNKHFHIILGLTAGTIFNFASGMFYFSIITSLSIPISFMYAVAPFIPSGIIKIVVLPTLNKKIKAALNLYQ